MADDRNSARFPIDADRDPTENTSCGQAGGDDALASPLVDCRGQGSYSVRKKPHAFSKHSHNLPRCYVLVLGCKRGSEKFFRFSIPSYTQRSESLLFSLDEAFLEALLLGESQRYRKTFPRQKHCNFQLSAVYESLENIKSTIYGQFKILQPFNGVLWSDGQCLLIKNI